MASGSEYPQSLETFIAALRRLPGVGRRSAERMALAMLEWPDEWLAELGERVGSLKTDITFCTQCGNFADDTRCAICQDGSRDAGLICVVEDAVQIPVIERSGAHRGLYHVLGGRLEPLAGKGPEDLTVEALRARIEAGGVRELILATSSDVEGEATATFIAREFAASGMVLSRIAAGVPVGSDLTFADSATIAAAMNRRRPF